MYYVFVFELLILSLKKLFCTTYFIKYINTIDKLYQMTFS